MTLEDALEIVLDAARQTAHSNALSPHTDGVAELQRNAVTMVESYAAAIAACYAPVIVEHYFATADAIPSCQPDNSE